MAGQLAGFTDETLLGDGLLAYITALGLLEWLQLEGVCVDALQLVGLVSFGPPQRKEAGEEELAPADDGSQAPVEASHACVCPVLSASLLSLGQDPATPRKGTMTSAKKKKKPETRDPLFQVRGAEGDRIFLQVRR